MKYTLLSALATLFILPVNSKSQDCLMAPERLTMEIPSSGFALPDSGIQDSEESCEPVSDSLWTKWMSRDFDFFVYADGPGGSGRYWNITVGISTTHEMNPKRGFCLGTATAGWRTLQHFNDHPLPWIDDRDADGKPELIIWDSFPLSDDASMAEWGLVGWVYQVDRSGRCKIDWNLSRKLAAEIATAYRKPLKRQDSTLKGLREKSASALEDFASGKCTPGNRHSH